MTTRLTAALHRNGRALAGLVIGAVIGCAAVFGWQPEGPPTNVLATQAAMVKRLHARIEHVQGLPLYPPLIENWRQVRARLRACGLTFEQIDAKQQPGLYAGPTMAWHAAVSGRAETVIACFLTLPEALDVVPGSYRIANHDMTLWLSVLGRHAGGADS